ncbi:ABC transporter ATP-binding protein [Lachnospiraceae bacterium 62-35]
MMKRSDHKRMFSEGNNTQLQSHLAKLTGIFRRKKSSDENISAGSGPLIRLENLVKIYDTGAIKVLGLKKINLSIERGEFVAIMGHSGSGKSTLMNILGCLDRPTLGHYYLDGQDTADMNQDQLSFIRNKKIGFVFQSFNLISRTSALKNVELPMTYARIPKGKRIKRAKELLERVGLGAREDHMPNELSGGQRQRVAIARALANEPPLILADEPTGNLDTAASIEIMELFGQLHKEGATVIVVTHEEDIAAFADRIIRFGDGKILSDEINKEHSKYLLDSNEAEERPADDPKETVLVQEPVSGKEGGGERLC